MRGTRIPSLTVPARPPERGRRKFGATWWGTAWLAALEAQAELDPNRLPRGRSYARSGAVGDTVVRPGAARAPVHGSRPEPYRVQVTVTTFDDAQWDRVLDAIAAQVGHTAALLDGELPPEVAEDVENAGLSLLPGPHELTVRCTCPDWAVPCKHAAAVCYVLCDVLDTDPFALLLLRGRGQDDLLAALRSRRGAAEAAAAPAGPAGVPATEAYRRELATPPRPLPPPDQPGEPVPLPPDDAVDVDGLESLAADAAARAHQVLTGTGSGGLDLDEDTDLVRRAARRLARGADLAPLRGGAGLFDEAVAWQTGGPAGLDTLRETWSPPAGDMAEGRAALAGRGGVRVWRNRLTVGDRQVRLGRDGRWYPYARSRAGHWAPDGRPATDPTEFTDG